MENNQDQTQSTPVEATTTVVTMPTDENGFTSAELLLKAFDARIKNTPEAQPTTSEKFSTTVMVNIYKPFPDNDGLAGKELPTEATDEGSNQVGECTDEIPAIELTSKILDVVEADPRQHLPQVDLPQELLPVIPSPKISELIDRFSKPKNNKKNKTDQVKKHVDKTYAPPVRQATSYLERAFKGTALFKEEDVDGVNHINIHSWGNTKIGRFLDIYSWAPFYHRELRNFNSVGGLWHFVKCVDVVDAFRLMYGRECRTEAKTHAQRDVDGFKTIIADATWMKINANLEAAADLTESTLPLQNYYLTEFKQKKYPVDSAWYVAAVEEIRRTLKKIKETGDNTLMPDFSFLEANEY